MKVIRCESRIEQLKTAWEEEEKGRKISFAEEVDGKRGFFVLSERIEDEVDKRGEEE